LVLLLLLVAAAAAVVVVVAASLLRKTVQPVFYLGFTAVQKLLLQTSRPSNLMLPPQEFAHGYGVHLDHSRQLRIADIGCQ
jgi:hypothetical protein